MMMADVKALNIIYLDNSARGIEGDGPFLNKVCGAMPIMVVTDMISKEYREGGI